MGRPVTEEGKAGIVIGTGFYTYAMPMIRYRTDDIAVYSERQCACGRQLPLITNIEGRLQELLVTSDGELISGNPLVPLNSPGFKRIEQFQFFQEKEGDLVFKIVPLASFSERDARLIVDELSAIFAGRMQVQLVCVDSIPQTRQGKYRCVDQRLPVTFDGSY